MKNFLNKGGLVVPTADTTNNAYAMDVVGNKSDAAAVGSPTTTESLMAYAKQVVNNTQLQQSTAEQLVSRSAANLPAGTSEALFTASGMIQVIQIIGVVTTVIQAQPCNMSLETDPDVGTGDTIADDLDINALAEGALVTASGTFAAPLFANDIGAIEGQPTPFTMAAGDIVLTTDATNTGQIAWTVLWKPLEIGAGLAAA
jgi:hypothetical protein